MIGYRITMTALLVLLTVPSVAPEKQTAEQGAVAAARDIVRGVEEKRPDAILAHVDRGGIPCVDSVVTRENVEKELKTRGSWYHAYFFEPTVFNERFRNAGYPISLAELVTKGGELRYRVRFQQYPKQPPFSFPCVSITSRQIKGKGGLCFFHEHGKWWLRDGPNCD